MRQKKNGNNLKSKNWREIFFEQQKILLIFIKNAFKRIVFVISENDSKIK